MNGLRMHDTIDLLIGVAFILFYSSNRFNTPNTNRCSTTAGRYYVALVLYCLAGLLFYLALVHFPNLVTFFVQGEGGVVPDWAKELTTPLLVTLLLTVLLPKLPLLSQIDSWIYKELQYMAAIPYEVRRLSAELRKAQSLVSDEDQDLLREELGKGGFSPEEILFKPEQVPAHLWVRLGILFVKIDDWRSDRKMSRYLQDFPAELDNLRKRYNQLLPKAKT